MANDISKTLRKFNYGIYIVTSRKDGDELSTRNQDWVSASTISFVMQTSMEPDCVAMAIQKDSNLAETVQRSGNFAVHILAKDDKEYVKEFQGPADFTEEEVNGYEFTKGQTGAPILDLGLGYVECELAETIDTKGDHFLFIGKVVNAKLYRPDATAIALEDTNFEYGG